MWTRVPLDNEGKPKYKYLLPLDDEIAERVRPLSKPYPNAPQVKTTLRLESIQERAGQHGPWRSEH